MTQKTYIPDEDELERNWVVFDASDVALGRLSTRVARVMRGKHKRYFTPHLDCGDGAIIINASDIKLTGSKRTQEYVRQHSTQPGGLNETSYEDLLEEDPSEIVYWAVRGMLPNNKLGDSIRQHLRIYNDSEHPHQAQDPIDYDWEQDRVPVDSAGGTT